MNLPPDAANAAQPGVEEPQAMNSAARPLSLIVACSQNGVIGVGGDLPWRIGADLKRFKQLTMGHAILMGRKTYDSLGRCLPGRTSIVISRNTGLEIPGAVTVGDMHQAVQAVDPDDSEPFVIGGGQVYRDALPWVQTVYLTRIMAEVEGDTFFPIDQLVEPTWRLTQRQGPLICEKSGIEYCFEDFLRR